ncbi:MAG TPA: hypothetical protein VMP01_01580 [Pirellulaceae bacterium]|nr:hypothetical protein [Pirellulaceae bacterium]
MFSYTELRGQSSLDKHGSIELNTTYVTSRKPLWLVCLKLVVLAGMASLGFAILVPLLLQWLPPWNAALVSLGILLIYIGVSFFCRPKCNSDNMGWFGGMANDPFQYSDNINRFLFQLHMLLGPGRFAAETLLDVCTLAGLAKGPEVIAEPEPAVALVEPSAYSHASNEPAALPSGLRSDRFDPSSGNGVWR